MKKINFKVLLLGIACISMTGLAHATGSDHLTIGPVTTISFEPGAAVLTQASKNRLKEVVADARAKGKIAEIQVAAWSDNPVPREGEELSKPDRKLAANRGEAIRSFLKKPLKINDIESYNMAERASWLARTFDTAEAELKTEIGRGGDGQLSREEFQIFREKGKASGAVALVMMKRN